MGQRMLTWHLPDLLRYLHALFEFVSVYPIDYGWSWILQSARAAHDGSPLCHRVRGDYCRGVVCRPLQCVSLTSGYY